MLLLHINFIMFIPQLDEVDVYDTLGRQTGDINSVTEYISQVLLGNNGTNRQDEDDDCARNLSIALVAFDCQQQVIEIIKPALPDISSEKFILYSTGKTQLMSFDVIAPPPEA